MQVVLTCLRQQRSIPGRRIVTAEVVRGLDYFAVPVGLWPVGLQLMRKALEVEKAVVKDILGQTCALALQAKPHNYSGSYSRRRRDMPFFGRFIIEKFDEQLGSYRVVSACSSLANGMCLPESLMDALVDAAKLERLNIEFKVARNELCVSIDQEG